MPLKNNNKEKNKKGRYSLSYKFNTNLKLETLTNLFMLLQFRFQNTLIYTITTSHSSPKMQIGFVTSFMRIQIPWFQIAISSLSRRCSRITPLWDDRTHYFKFQTSISAWVDCTLGLFPSWDDWSRDYQLYSLESTVLQDHFRHETTDLMIFNTYLKSTALCRHPILPGFILRIPRARI